MNVVEYGDVEVMVEFMCGSGCSVGGGWVVVVVVTGYFGNECGGIWWWT